MEEEVDREREKKKQQERKKNRSSMACIVQETKMVEKNITPVEKTRQRQRRREKTESDKSHTKQARNPAYSRKESRLL